MQKRLVIREGEKNRKKETGGGGGGGVQLVSLTVSLSKIIKRLNLLFCYIFRQYFTNEHGNSPVNLQSSL